LSFAFFLACLTGDARPCLHRPWWREHLTSVELTSLERHGWLRNEGRTDWYPCAGNCPELSRRRVLPDPLDDDRWQTECPAFECLDEVVTSPDLEQLSAQGTTLALWLRERLRGSGPLQAFERPGLHGLGHVEWNGQTREGVLVTGVTPPELPQVLRELQDITERWFVFVPEQRRLPVKLRGQHGPRAAVQVVGLDEWLEFAGGQPVLRLPVLEVREPAAPAYAAEPIVAEVFEATGKRGLSTAAYDALVGRRSSFDLFIDMTIPGTKRGGPVRVRDEQGQSTEVELAAREVAVLVELVQARKPMRMGEFRSVNVQSLDKMIERARRKIEGEGRRGNWRFFHTLSGVESSAKSFLFKPQEGLTFAVILPASPP
jgi:hypothetical protein